MVGNGEVPGARCGRVRAGTLPKPHGSAWFREPKSHFQLFGVTGVTTAMANFPYFRRNWDFKPALGLHQKLFQFPANSPGVSTLLEAGRPQHHFVSFSAMHPVIRGLRPSRPETGRVGFRSLAKSDLYRQPFHSLHGVGLVLVGNDGFGGLGSKPPERGNEISSRAKIVQMVGHPH